MSNGIHKMLVVLLFTWLAKFVPPYILYRQVLGVVELIGYKFSECGIFQYAVLTAAQHAKNRPAFSTVYGIAINRYFVAKLYSIHLQNDKL